MNTVRKAQRAPVGDSNRSSGASTHHTVSLIRKGRAWQTSHLQPPTPAEGEGDHPCNGLLEYRESKAESTRWRHKSERDTQRRDRQLAKARQKSKVAKKKPKHKMEFDSTLGYPGEGPARGRGRGRGAHGGPAGARGVRRCYKCGNPGHLAAACPLPGGGLVIDLELNAQQAALLPGAAAIAQLPANLGAADAAAEVVADNAENPQGAVVPPGGGGEPAEDPELARRRAIDRIMADMRAKAGLMWNVKNLDDPRDRAVVLTSLANIARSSALHDQNVDVAYIAMQVCDEMRYEALQRRRYAAEVSGFDGLAIPIWKRMANKLLGVQGVVESNRRSYWETTIEHMKRLELRAPYSLPDDGLDWASRAKVILFKAVLEELVKRILGYVVGEFYTSRIQGLLVKLFRHYGWTRALKCARIVHLASSWYGRFCVANCFANWESRSRPLQFAPRWFAHTWLANRNLLVGSLCHTAWNLGCDQLCPALSLDVTQTPLSTHEDICASSLITPAVCVTSGGSVKWGPAECVPRFGTRSFGGVKGVRPTVFRACACNEKIAISGRVMKDLPTYANRDLVVKRWASVTSEVLPLFGLARVYKPINFESWVSVFPPRKARMFREMREGIRESRVSKRKGVVYEASGFIKREKANKEVYDDLHAGRFDWAISGDVDGLKDPRYIQAPPPELTLKAGPYVRKFAKNLRRWFHPKSFDRHDIAGGRHFVYACGMTNSQIGTAYAKCIDMINSVRLPGERLVVIEDDQSRFDMHMGPGPFRFLDRLYSRKLPQTIRRALRRKKSFGMSKLRTRHVLDEPSMQSGWPDTSAGDTAVNMACKLHIHGNGKRWVSIVCGDDSVTITLDTEVERMGGATSIKSQYFDLGLEVKVFVRDDAEDAEFCSGRFMPCNGSFILVPKTGKILARILHDTVDRPAREWAGWLRGIAASCSSFVWDPVLVALGRAIIRETGEGEVITEFANPWKINYSTSVRPSQTDTDCYFDRHYNMSASQLDDVCEKVYRTFSIGHNFDDPIIVNMAKLDL